jgi:hypothetical protein
MMMHSQFLALLKRIRRGLLIACFAVALPGVALCQLEDETDPLEEEQEEIRFYTVEMIIFEYQESAVTGNETFAPDEILLDEQPLPMTRPPVFSDPGININADAPVAIDSTQFDQVEELEFLLPEEPEEEQVLEELPSHILQTRLEVLDPEEYAMKDIYEKLAELGAYKPIMRAAWTQATFEKDQTIPIRLRRLGNAPLRLDGSLTLYLSRYLHLVVDLTIEGEREPLGTGSGSRYDDVTRYYGDRRSSRDYGYGYEQPATPVKYNIFEDRIFRNGEMRYYDHPRFGVLARITRVEEEEEEELETDEMFLLPAESNVSDNP